MTKQPVNRRAKRAKPFTPSGRYVAATPALVRLNKQLAPRARITFAPDWGFYVTTTPTGRDRVTDFFLSPGEAYDAYISSS